MLPARGSEKPFPAPFQLPVLAVDLRAMKFIPLEPKAVGVVFPGHKPDDVVFNGKFISVRVLTAGQADVPDGLLVERINNLDHRAAYS